MSQLTENIRARAKRNIKKIVLAEGSEPRILEAAKEAVKEKLAEIIILGDTSEVKYVAEKAGLDLNSVTMIDPISSGKLNAYADVLYELRRHKGMTEEAALELVKTPLYFGALMVKTGEADGMVCGAVTASADVLRCALRVIRPAENVGRVSTAFFIRVPGNERVYAFADCVVNVNPTASQAADIAITTAKTYAGFIGEEPRVAMLSYATYGLDTDKVIHKMQEAAYIAKERCPGLMIDGEMQLDAAIDESVAKIKAKHSSIGGRANVLIFPDLNSGNISYKLVQRLCNAEVTGPIIQGLNKPVNDLSRGCSAEEIVDVIAITSIQAK